MLIEQHDWMMQDWLSSQGPVSVLMEPSKNSLRAPPQSVKASFLLGEDLLPCLPAWPTLFQAKLASSLDDLCQHRDADIVVVDVNSGECWPHAMARQITDTFALDTFIIFLCFSELESTQLENLAVGRRVLTIDANRITAVDLAEILNGMARAKRLSFAPSVASTVVHSAAFQPF